MDDHEAMREALAAARLGVEADPNPRVGCLIVPDDGSGPVLGWHRGAGTPHAEVDALSRAGSHARGATAYVTLEPCTHHGRTGPCADRLVAAGVRRVVHAVPDPNPVAAGGAAYLRARGVEVTEGVLQAEAEEVNASWMYAQRTGRPWVVAKMATSLDGRVAAVDGSSRWVTGPAARGDAHRLRARSGAVLVGSGTVVADDPHLTVRRPDGTLADRQPLRVVIGHRPPPRGSRILDTAAGTLQLATHDPVAVLSALAERGVHRALIEGGPTLATAFLRAGLVDEVVAYIAPALLGGGPLAIGDLGVATIAEAVRFVPTDVTPLWPDIRVTARPLHRPAISPSERT